MSSYLYDFSAPLYTFTCSLPVKEESSRRRKPRKEDATRMVTEDSTVLTALIALSCRVVSSAM